MSIIVRKAKYEDRQAAVAAEHKAVRNLYYLDEVWDQFYNDENGELLVGEVDGVVVAVGKYTTLPDRSVWLETLRVDPQFQGRGIGKAFYERFVERATEYKTETMGMYTGTSNVVSKGLAERYGFSLAATYRGASWKLPGGDEVDASEYILSPGQEFSRADAATATEMATPLFSNWDNHIVLNRTFYPATTGNIAGMARSGWAYHHEATKSFCILGSRFLKERGLHLALCGGDVDTILAFAKAEVWRQQLPQVTIMFPPKNSEFEAALLAAGFVLEPSDCIVMARRDGYETGSVN